ncbi:hypothetical protein FNV43_RR06504 [Rhamnella rubrinervis]|uniref:Uncharacterized protein n=1 Tax=Rhamnella rubrinervis TaxID=2594499 RepID=A0A8K0HE17_9ROSA|nr:hypothetical protein FNV43_RR06504 [Rhamnella rubrinervis]
MSGATVARKRRTHKPKELAWSAEANKASLEARQGRDGPRGRSYHYMVLEAWLDIEATPDSDGSEQVPLARVWILSHISLTKRRVPKGKFAP